MRHRRFAITDHYRSALRGLAEKQLREIKRHADTTVAGWVTGRLPECMAMPVSRQSLHVGHGRVVVFLRVMFLFLFENGENAAGRGVSFRAGAHGGAANQNAIAIDVHHLLGDAHEEHEGDRSATGADSTVLTQQSGPVGRPVGVPLVWKEGFSTACAAKLRAMTRSADRCVLRCMAFLWSRHADSRKKGGIWDVSLRWNSPSSSRKSIAGSKTKVR